MSNRCKQLFAIIGAFFLQMVTCPSPSLGQEDERSEGTDPTEDTDTNTMADSETGPPDSETVSIDSETDPPTGPPDLETGPPDSETGPPDSEAGPPDSETGPPDSETGPPDSETGPPDSQESESLDTSESSEELLDMSLEELLDMTITVASRTAVEASTAPSIVTVISRETIERMGYRSVAEALKTVPGFFVVDDLVTHNVAVRGVHGGPDSWSRIIKVMINGHEATYGATSGVLLGLELIPIEVVESIEVVRGTGSALYGANAFLGVVNIVTRKPKDGLHLESSGEIGWVNKNLSGGGGALSSVAWENSYMLVSFHRDYVDRSGLTVPDNSPAKDEWGDEKSENDIARPWTLLADGSFDLGFLGTLHAQYNHQHLDTHGEFSQLSTLTHKNRIAVNNDIVGLDHRLDIVEETLNLHSYTTFASAKDLPEQHLEVGEQAAWFRREQVTRNMMMGTELSLLHRNQSFLMGFEYRGLKDSADKSYQVVRVDSGFSDAGDLLLYKSAVPMSISNYGLFGQLMLTPIEALNLTGGIRHDWNDTWGNNFSYRIAAVYSFLFGLSLKAVYGTSYVPPAPAQLEHSPLRFEGGIIGNPDLKSQKASTLDLGIEYRYRDRFSVGLNGFYTEIKDRVEFVFIGNTLTAENVAASRSLGAEFSAKGVYRALFSQFDLSYQYTIPTDKPELAPSWWRLLYSADGEGGERLLYCPALMMHGNVGVNLPQYYFQASTAVHFVGKRKSSASNLRYQGEAYQLPRYATVDITLRTLGLTPFEDKTTTVSLHANNIFDRRFAEAGYLGVDIPNTGRTLYLQLTQEF